MASEVEICSRALQKLGASRITSLTENTVNARACNFSYTKVRDAELEDHPWNFAVMRAQLAADATPPVFGRANAFELPADFIKLLPTYPEDNVNSLDHQIEGRKIYTDDGAPLEIRYIGRIIDPNLMTPLFRETLSAKLAYELAEELTQSNSKKKTADEDYKDQIARAKKSNAFARVSSPPPEDKYITVRA